MSGLITDYMKHGSGAPSGAPSVPSGETAYYYDDTGDAFYVWKPGAAAWHAAAGGATGAAGGDLAGTYPNPTVSQQSSRLPVKASVRVAATANVTVSSPGAAIDGVTLSNGDRILLTAQTAGAENGIYVFNGSASAMTRDTDANAAAQFVAGFQVYVREGTAGTAKTYVHTTSGTITLGTTALTFVALGSGGGGGTGTSATLLNYVQASDITALTMAADTWTDFLGNQSFTVGALTSTIELSISGFVQLVSSSGNHAYGVRAVLDSAGTAQNVLLDGGVSTPTGANLWGGAGLVSLGSLSAGIHTVKLQILHKVTNADVYVRPTASPATESLRVQVFERK